MYDLLQLSLSLVLSVGAPVGQKSSANNCAGAEWRFSSETELLVDGWSSFSVELFLDT